MKKQLLTTLSIGVMSISMAFATPQQAVSQVRENASQVLKILQKSNGKNDAVIRKEAEAYAMPYFDFQRMTALAVGNAWNQATPTQKQALTNEFKSLLIGTYTGTMFQYKTSQVKIRDNPQVKGKQTLVQAEITPPSGKTVVMDFVTYQSGNKYRVYDVKLEGQSLIATTYRNQFNQVINQKGIDGLIAELKAKNNK